MANRKWPEKNPETKRYSLLDTPLSTDAAGPDPRPGNNPIIPDDAMPPNPVGYAGMDHGKGKKK